MDIKQFILDDQDILIITLDNDLSTEEIKEILKMYQECFPDIPIIVNTPSWVKEITVIKKEGFWV